MRARPLRRQRFEKYRTVFESALADVLLATAGTWLSGRRLWMALGYPSQQAFERAARLNRVPVKLYAQLNGRGRCARTADVAKVLADEILRVRVRGGDV